jgi:hypothetical protein
MRRLLLLFLLTFLIISCGAPSTPLAVPTARLISTVTTSPTIVSTVTLEPTPTLDPNAPQGTQGKDDKGIYIEANGVKNRQIELVDPVTGETTTVWAFSAIEGEQMIALVDYPKEENANGWGDQIKSQLLVDPRVSGSAKFPVMSYNQDEWLLGQDGKTPTFSGVFYPFLESSRAVNTPGMLNRLDNVIYHFTTSAGAYDWKIAYKDDGSDATTIIRRVEDLHLVEGNGVKKIQDPYNGDNHFYIKMYSVNKKLVTEIASEVSLDQLSDKEKAFMMMFGQLSVILTEDQVKNMDISNIKSLVNMALESKFPYIVLTPKP